jgi:hypothetical protein
MDEIIFDAEDTAHLECEMYMADEMVFPDEFDEVPVPEMYNTDEFKAHVKRLLNPLKPGLKYVRTEDFIRDFEDDPDETSNLTPQMLSLARVEAVKCIDLVEKEIEQCIYADARRYLKERDIPGWSAKSLDEMQTVLSAFCDTVIGEWDDTLFPEYKRTNMYALNEHGFGYVKSFVGSALAAMPYHIEDEDNLSVYYDSDETVCNKED